MIELFMQLLGEFLNIVKYNDEQLIRKSQAVKVLKDALRSTRKHIDETRDDIDEDNYTDVDSTVLSDKWAKAADLIRPFNNELGRTLEQKSDYWRNPSGFKSDIQNGKRRYDFRFRLNVIIEEINRIEANWKNL